MDGRSGPLAGVEGLLVDIDGVLVVSWEPLLGAPEALERVRRAGIAVRFLTNTTSITRAGIVDRLDRAGIAATADEVLTAPAATAAWLRANEPDARCLLLNSGDLTSELEGIELVGVGEPADVVVLGGAGPEFTYEALNAALGLLLDGARLVAMHANRYWRTADGFSLDTGGFVAALEHAAHVRATVVGKPAPALFSTAVDALGAAAGRTAMVGDDIESDVLAAQAVGIIGVLVETGKYRPEAVADAPGRPDHQVASFADVPDLLGLA